jgi:two-component sensor histidine kinase
VDISERKAIEERQSILILEMDHRIRNNLAQIEAIMGSTIRVSTTLKQFEQAVLGRIGALAKTNSLLTQRPRDSVSLRRLLENELEMYRDGEGGRITCLGPEIAVPPHIAVPLGMAIHELATNAAKYGTLSGLGGTLSVQWD